MKTTATNQYFDILGNRIQGSGGNFVSLRMYGSTGQLVTEVDQDDTVNYYYIAFSNTTGLNNGGWHHIAAVRQGTTLKVYINGALDASVPSPGVANLNGNNPFKLGKSYPGFNPANIQFKDVRIHNGQALCPKRISRIFNEGNPSC